MQRAEVDGLLMQAIPIAEVSQLSGVPVPTLYRWARDLPGAPERRPRGPGDDHTARRRELLAAGVSPARVAAGVEFDLPPCTASACRQLRARIRQESSGAAPPTTPGRPASDAGRPAPSVQRRGRSGSAGAPDRTPPLTARPPGDQPGRPAPSDRTQHMGAVDRVAAAERVASWAADYIRAGGGQ